MTIDNENFLLPGQQIKAELGADQAKQLVETRYGLRVKSIVELDAYDDRNYRVQCEEQLDGSNPHLAGAARDGYVLKIVNSLDSRKTGFVDAQNQLLIFLGQKEFVCPVPVKQKDGSYFSVETLGGKEEKRHVLRLLVFRPGDVMQRVPATARLLKSIGTFAARLNEALKEFSHPAYDTQTSLWTLSSVPKIRDFMFVLNNKEDAALVNEIIEAFEEKVLPAVDSLDSGIIHGDLNEYNIIVNSQGDDVAAIIDFGDSHKGCYVFELAICMCYMLIQAERIDMLRHVIEGYQKIRPLTKQEKDILKLCVCARLCQSYVLGSYSHQREPNNMYLVRTHTIKWTLLKKLWPMDDEEIISAWGIGN